MRHSRMTVHDLRARRVGGQMTMLYVETRDAAAAAAEAGIDILSIIAPLWTPDMRAAAGDCFVQVGLLYADLVTAEDYLRAAFAALKTGGDAFYCAAGLGTVRALADEGLAVIGHLGLVPSKATWTGGFRAVGRSADQALACLRAAEALEAAGAVGAEIEVIPEAVAAEIARRTGLVLFSMGAGAGCHAQYLFAEDVLGQTRGHRPRHAKTYRDFAAEDRRLQGERVAAFRDFADDVATGRYPEPRHLVTMPDTELAAFRAALKDERAKPGVSP